MPEKHKTSTCSNPSQITDINTPIVYLPMVESSFGIVGACLPMLRPLFTRTSTSGNRRTESPVEEALVEMKQPAVKFIYASPGWDET